MKISIQLPLRVNEQDDEWIIGPVSQSEEFSCDESDAVRRAFLAVDQRGTLIDVGAHRGTVSVPFLKDGWKVLSFEPDPDNYWHLLRRVNSLRKSFQDQFTHIPCAVSDVPHEEVAFFKSHESSGVSTLSPFLDSHEQAFSVKADTLTNFMAEHGVASCDFLKTDIEGFDFAAIKGYPWEAHSPEIIECEFEDAKSIKLGYSWTDLADFLVEHGYEVLVSEWHPIERYGVSHSWKGLRKYPCALENEAGWGNLVAFKNREYYEHIVKGVLENASGVSPLSLLEKRPAEAKTNVPSTSHNAYLFPEPNYFYREVFENSFLKGGNIEAKIEFDCIAGQKLKIIVMRHGKSPAEQSVIDWVSVEGRNSVTLSHTVKNLQFAFLVAITNQSSQFVIARNLGVEFTYNDSSGKLTTSSVHPLADFSEPKIYDSSAGSDVERWNAWGKKAEISFNFNGANNGARSFEARSKSWDRFTELAFANKDLFTAEDWNAVSRGLSSTAEMIGLDRSPESLLELSDDIKRPKLDGCMIYDVPANGHKTEITSFECEKPSRYQIRAEYICTGGDICFETQIGSKGQNTELALEQRYYGKETIFDGLLETGDKVSVFAKTTHEDVRILSVETVDMENKEISNSDVLQVMTSTIARNLPAVSVLRKQNGIEEMRSKDIERMDNLRGRFKGERIFVMGSGPSLNSTSLEKLKDEYVFGMNRVSLLFDRIKWRPTFYTAFDVRVVPDNAAEIADLDIEYKFFSSRYRSLLGEKENHYFHSVGANYDGFGHCFTKYAPYCGFGGGGTISVIAIQMAHFLGFEDIYLIGTDVSYKVLPTVIQDGKYALGGDVKLELTSTKDDDPNHFDSRYFGKGKKWHNPNVEEMKIGFARSANYIGQLGGSLKNATVGGDLNEVERVDFDSLF